MNMTLTEFLLDNPVDNVVEEVKLSDRFKDKEGNDLLFKIKADPVDEFAALQKKHNKIGKKGRVDFDNEGFNLDMAIEYTLNPDFRNADMVKKAGCLTPKQLINKVLKAGELTELVKQITLLSGFEEEDTEELKEKAKN